MSHPIKRLVRLVARAFYAGDCPPKDHEDAEAGTTSRGNSRNKVATEGLAIVILDYLVEREWVQEAVMLNELKVHPKIMRRALKYLEQEHFLMAEHRRETAARKDVVNAVTAAQAAASAAAAAAMTASGNGDEEEIPDDGFEARPPRGLTISYYAIDYPCFFDALQLKLHLMRKSLKDELEVAHAVQEYACSTSWCGKRFTSLDAAVLVDRRTGELMCDICQAPLQQLLASGGVGDEKERKARRETARKLIQRLDTDLRDITNLVSQCKNVASPHPGTLSEWAQEAAQRQRLAAQNGRGTSGYGGSQGSSSGGGHRSSTGGVGGSSVPWQETQIKVNLHSSAGPAPPSAGALAAGRSGAAGPSMAAVDAVTAAAGVPAVTGAGAAPSKPAPIPWFTQQASTPANGRITDDKNEDGKTAQQSAVYQAFVQQYMAQLQQQQQQQAQQQQGLYVAPSAITVAAAPQPTAVTREMMAASESAGADDEVEWEDI